MRLTNSLSSLAFIAALSMSSAADAELRTYIYMVEHPLYGNIGTYTDAVDDSDGVTRIDSRLRVVVRMMGFVIYREEADRSEIWHGLRLVSFDSATDKGGHLIRVAGEARDGGFYVTSASGTTLAPADVAPSDPWALKRVGAGVVVSTSSGRIDNVDVTGGEAASISMQGVLTPTRHFHVRTETQVDKWEIWFDQQGVPVKFRSLEAGTPIDFVIESMPPPAARPPDPITIRNATAP